MDERETYKYAWVDCQNHTGLAMQRLGTVQSTRSEVENVDFETWESTGLMAFCQIPSGRTDVAVTGNGYEAGVYDAIGLAGK
jgi:hypothetical protein